MVVRASEYSVLSPGLYEIGYAEVLWRLVGSTGAFVQFGDCDSFTLNIATTKKDRFRKNARVKTKAISIIDSLDATVSFKAMQATDFVRLAGVLGKNAPYSQDAGAAVEHIAPASLGVFYLPHLNISEVLIQGLTADTHFRIVDEAAGGVEVMELPAGVAEGSPLNFTYSHGAVLAGISDKISIGKQPILSVELRVRKVNDAGIKEIFNIFRVDLTPANGLELISSNDDFGGLELTGAAYDTNDGIGYRQKLAA